ncbi:MAG: O-antigen ligase family protein [Bacteroidia bacterium]
MHQEYAHTLKESTGRRRLPLFLLFLTPYALVLALMPVLPNVHYMRYMLPVLSTALIFLVLSVRNIKLQKNVIYSFLKLFLFLIAISFLTFLWHGEIYLRFFQEAYFILAPLIFMYGLTYLHDDKETGTRDHLHTGAIIIFWGVVLGYLLFGGQQTVSTISSIAKDPSRLLLGIITSDIGTEGGAYTFALSFFTIYFFTTKKKRYFLLSLFLSILAFKRIALAGIGVSILIYWLLQLKTFHSILNQRNLFPATMVGLNLAVIALQFMLSRGIFNSAIQDVTGLPANMVFMGRLNAYNTVLETLERVPLLGIGLGKTSQILAEADIGLAHIHSDLLKYFLEFGPVLFCVWIFAFYRFSMVNSKNLVLMLFLNVLFLTDNVSIYFEIMFLFFFLGYFNYPTKDAPKQETIKLTY